MTSSKPKMEPLPNAFGETEDHYWEGDGETAAKPLVELEMIQMSRALRFKPSWWTKFRDPEILAKWRTEALEQTNLMKESHIDYVLKELDGYAKLRDEETGVEVACYDRIWQSNRLIPTILRAKLISEVVKLENMPDSEKDWHPNSNGMVLDLVHPSLYPIVYGRTLAYPEGEVSRDPLKLGPILPLERLRGEDEEGSFWDHYVDYHMSQKFQWLPTDFAVSEDGKSVKSVSYINNLHPDHHRDLHKIVEGLVGAFLPLFERVLTDSIPENGAIPARTNNSYSYDEDYKPKPVDPDDENDNKPENEHVFEDVKDAESTDEHEDESENLSQYSGQEEGDDGQEEGDDGQEEGDDGQEEGDDGQEEGDDGQEEGDDGQEEGDDGQGENDGGQVENEGSEGEAEENETEHDKLYREWSEGRPIHLPDVDSKGYVLGSLEERDTWYSLAGRTIQVIVKLANIHLTPEKPEYAGGSWHVEGMSNEAIAASGIYYYDEENITESRLAFRTAASIPGTYEQSDERGCILTWGKGRNDLCVNELGSVVTCQDRTIAFPNIYQHKVSPFGLQDKTRPGHRKIVALFLIDPAIHRPSTTSVPPQQRDWGMGAVSANPNFNKLSPEIANHISTLVEGTMRREEAEAYRLELMAERKAFVVKNDERFFQVAFDLCEH